SSTLARPAQRRLGIASTRRFYQTLQRPLQRRLTYFGTFAASAPPTLTACRGRGGVIQFLDAASDRGPSNSRRRTHGRNATASQRHRFDRRPTSAREFRQLAREAVVFVPNPFRNAMIRHAQSCASKRC